MTLEVGTTLSMTYKSTNRISLSSYILKHVKLLQYLPISKRRNHQSSRVTDILVSVYGVCVGLPDVTVFSFAVPVKLQLGEPLESTHMHAS